jgi:Spy/CpxP family protein refolding chaperone
MKRRWVAAATVAGAVLATAAWAQMGGGMMGGYGPGGYGAGAGMMGGYGPGGYGAPGLGSSERYDRLNLTDEQREKIERIQRDARRRIDAVLTREQREQLRFGRDDRLGNVR